MWYISTQGLTRLRRMIEGYNSYHWEPKKVNVGSNTILVLCENKGNLNLEYFWSVENGEAVFHDYISGKGEFFDSDGHSEFVLSVCTDEDIGELSDRNPDGNPFTKKWYWFYWDASEKMIKEHGGIEITQQQFLKYTGAQKIIKAIRSEGYRIVNIFYRDNHLFNVNYVDSRGVFGNVALVYSMDFEMGDNKMIYLKNYFDSDTPIGWEYDSYAYDFCEKFSEAANRGIYKKSLAPEIATYPKELPKP